MQLEKETCDCIKDWRHYFLKYMLFGNLLLIGLFFLSGMLMYETVDGFANSGYATLAISMIFLINIINTYCYFTYVSDLNTTKCNCLKDMPNINKFLSVMKWVYVGATVISFIPWFIDLYKWFFHLEKIKYKQN